MNEQTDTPETDSLIDSGEITKGTSVAAIRKLERDRNALMELINRIVKDKWKMDWLDHTQFRIEKIQEIEYRIKKGFVTARDAIDDAMAMLSELKEILKGDE
jgi:hypothetical protein